MNKENEENESEITPQFENETITTSDYIQDVQAETVAKLNIEIHQIQLNEAIEKYNLIKGKSVQ